MAGDGSRRRFLCTLGGVAGTSLAGCLSDRGAEAGSGAEATIDGGNDQFRSSMGLPTPEYELEPQLNVLQWRDYWHGHAVSDFEDAYGVDVSVRFYDSNEELLEILTSEGYGTYDVAFPSDWAVTTLIRDNRLQPVALEKLTNWENLGDRWIDDAPYDQSGQRYSVPYQWGTSGIAWHEELVDGPLDEIPDLDSWDALWNDEYADQIVMMDLPREAFAVALKRLGYSLNTTDRNKIDEAAELLEQQRPLVDTYGPADQTDPLINQQATPMHAFSGEANSARIQLRAGGDSPVEYHIPAEGGVVWVDAAVIPHRAPHPNAAHAFINYLLDDWVGAEISNYTFYATPNEAAEEGVVNDILDNPGIYPDATVLDRLEFIRDVGDANEYYREAWNRITAD